MIKGDLVTFKKSGHRRYDAWVGHVFIVTRSDNHGLVSLRYLGDLSLRKSDRRPPPNSSFARRLEKL